MEYKTKQIEAFNLDTNQVRIEEEWFQVVGDAAKFLKNIKVGQATVGFDDDGQVVFLKSQEDKPQPTNQNTHKFEDDMVSFEELLTDAYKKKEDFSIKTEMLQLDPEKRFALFKARITAGDKTFEGHGDATEENVKGMISQHYIRMAETRAIVRALRWYTNNAKCAKEEIK